VNVVAPIPARPRLYKAGDEVHRAIITFTIELNPPAGGTSTPATEEAETPA